MILPPHSISSSTLHARSIGAGSGIAAGGSAASNSNNNRYIIGFSIAAFVTLAIVAGYFLYKRGCLHRAVGKKKPPRKLNASRKNHRPRRSEWQWPGTGVNLVAPPASAYKEKGGVV